MWQYGQRHSTPAISGIGGWEWSDHTRVVEPSSELALHD